MPVAWPEALRPDKPGLLRPGQARPNVGLEWAQGLGLKILKPEPGLQALAWTITHTATKARRWMWIVFMVKSSGGGRTYGGPGSGPSQVRPSPTRGLGLWPEESQAQARSSQAKAKPGHGHHYMLTRNHSIWLEICRIVHQRATRKYSEHTASADAALQAINNNIH
ncbi:hypothetical protein FB451DRAFT_1167493 [Mycena latifolia]|nr:hypothetical protein FB451DRAFT_1167493 [Mycena latifolia]